MAEISQKLSYLIALSCKDCDKGKAGIVNPLSPASMGHDGGRFDQRDSTILQRKDRVRPRPGGLLNRAKRNYIMNQITIKEIEQARARISNVARRTPVERSMWLSNELGREVWLKLECFQVTGAFKIRGAMARLSRLSEAEKARGILTVSAGNHGLAVAHCAQALSLSATIVVPESASRAKVAGLRRYPVTLVERGASYDEAERIARQMERETGATFVSPYNDEDVIAGQGTIALEMIEDAPPIDSILAPVGGGGLIAGIAIAAKAINPRIKVYGVEPKASPTM